MFRGKRGGQIKILWHDGLGLSLYAPNGWSAGRSCGGARCDKQPAAENLAGGAIDDGQRRPGVVDEQPFARHVHLPHGRRQTAVPGPVQIAELAVAVAARMNEPMLLPEQMSVDELVNFLATDNIAES